jgi:hypothetical protein
MIFPGKGVALQTEDEGSNPVPGPNTPGAVRTRSPPTMLLSVCVHGCGTLGDRRPFFVAARSACVRSDRFNAGGLPTTATPPTFSAGSISFPMAIQSGRRHAPSFGLCGREFVHPPRPCRRPPRRRWMGGAEPYCPRPASSLIQGFSLPC